MDNEVFNLEYHKRRLILRALNAVGNLKHAAPKLGISERNLHRLKDAYGIRRNGKTWTIAETNKTQKAS